MQSFFYKVLATVFTVALLIGGVSVAWAQGGLRDQTVDMVILLDRSGSMRTTDPAGLSVAAASFVVEQLGLANDRNRVAVVPFGDEAFVLGQSPDKTDPANALQRPSGALVEMLSAGVSDGTFEFREARPENPSRLLTTLRAQMKTGNNTHLLAALQMARKILRGTSNDAQKCILLISDGTPDIMSLQPALLRDLAEQLGFPQNLLRNIRVYNQRYSEYILKNEAPALGRERINLIPVSFQTGNQWDDTIDQYLRELRKEVNGDEEVIKANAVTLIAGLRDAIPSGSNHIVLRHSPDFVAPGATGGRLDLSVPDVALQSRFFFAYSETTASQVPRIRIFREGTLLADSAAPESNSSAVFHSLRKNNGGLVYQSITITDAAQAAGSFRIEVGNSQGSTGVPPTALYVDIRSRLYPLLEFGQQQVCSPARLDLQLTLFDEREVNAPTVKPVETARLSLRRLGTLSPIPLETQVNETGVVTAQLDEGLREEGTYRLDAELCFEACRDPDPQNRIAVRFHYDMPVASCTTPQLWVVRKNSQQIDPNLKIELPPLGETMAVQSTSFEARTDFNGVLPPGVTISIAPPRHTERTDRELISGGVSWAKVKPPELRGNLFQRGAPLTISVEIPGNEVPSTLPDGIYTTDLEIRQGTRAIASVPVVVPVKIPRFVTNKDQVNTPFDPDDAILSPVVEKTVRYPGEGLHYFKIGLWSSSLDEVEAIGTFGENGEQYGIRMDGQEESGEREPKIVFGQSEASAPVPGKNNSSPGRLSPWVRVDDPSLNGQSFTNILYLSGPRHRPQQVRLLVKLDFIPSYYLRGGAALFLVLAIWFAFRWSRLWRCRGFFIGAVTNLRFVEGRNQYEEIRCGDRSLGEWRYDGSDFPDDDGESPVVLSTQVGTCLRDDESTNLQGEEYHPQMGDAVTLGRNRQSITLSVSALPGVGRPLRYRIIRSPFGRGRSHYLLLAATLLFGAIGVIGIIYPYLLLQMVRW